MRTGTNHLTIVLSCVLLTPHLGFAQITLSGVTIWASGADGTWLDRDSWNTRGPDWAWNVYLFTGSISSPTFLNGGDSDASLNPDLRLSPGTNIIRIAGSTGFGLGPYVGLNLYFNGDLSTNRISVVLPNDGTGGLSVIGRSVTTYGEDGAAPSAGTDTFTVGGSTVRLIDFHISTSPYPDLADAYSVGADGRADAVGSFTLVVEPATASLTVEISEVRLCWNSESNKAYQLQYRSELTTNAWVNLALIAGNGATLCLTDPVEGPRKFYRIITLP